MNNLNTTKGNQLRDKGIKQALESAENETENWGNLAYNFLLHYIKTNKEFMTEDVRIASFESVPQPPSNRAWGYVVVRAKKNDLITRKGYSCVKNPKAHRTPATLWVVN